MLLLTVTAGFAAGGVLMAQNPSAAVPGWFCAILFGLGAVLAAAQLVTGSRLTLSPAGMRLEHFGRSRSWSWADVSNSRVWASSNNRCVTFDHASAGPGTLRDINASLGAGSGTLPPSWNVSAPSLCILLEDCRRRWS